MVEQQDSVFIVGKWKGKGTVLGKGLEYQEETTFIQLRSDPVIVINAQQYTSHETIGPLHAENGFIKILPTPEGQDSGSRKVEAMFSHPFSLNEFEYGQYSPSLQSLSLESSKPEHYQRGSTAKGKQTTGFRRDYWLDPATGELCYKMHLAVDGGALVEHLEGRLKKVE